MNKTVLTIVKVIACIIAIGLLITSGFFLHAGYVNNEILKDAIDAEPIRIKVDVSKPGVYSGDFTQTFSSSHNEYVYIENPMKEINLESLRGTLEIKNLQGENVIEFNFSDTSLPDYVPPTKDEYLVRSFRPFAKGKYKLILTVDEPVKELENTEQYLVARYGMCGLETLSVYILNGIGAILLTTGSVISIVLIRKQFFTNRTK